MTFRAKRKPLDKLQGEKLKNSLYPMGRGNCRHTFPFPSFRQSNLIKYVIHHKNREQKL